ncbi:predicted protein [Streptomyces filamentosus NRRL 15998]|uniref:Predicted protein n=1 Tax=Streptomyces filamentosus NRRL 15998 TaxID=457431 RepID=D6AEN0_STRFL|nr:predicted protein [Streptomyces filamentosus NRRL 15998]
MFVFLRVGRKTARIGVPRAGAALSIVRTDAWEGLEKCVIQTVLNGADS